MTRSISNSRERDKQLFSIDIDRTKKNNCTKIERRVLKSENCSGKKEKIVFETCTAHKPRTSARLRLPPFQSSPPRQ